MRLRKCNSAGPAPIRAETGGGYVTELLLIDPRGEIGSAVSVWDALRTNQNSTVPAPIRAGGGWAVV